eukprot:scaffold40525_cov40-Attheya_sp.AAC.1
MTHSSAVWATDVEANDLGEDKPTLSRASTSLPFDDTRDDDEEDYFDAEAGWYVPVSIFMRSLYVRNEKILATFSHVITLFPVPPITCKRERNRKREHER